MIGINKNQLSIKTYKDNCAVEKIWEMRLIYHAVQWTNKDINLNCIMDDELVKNQEIGLIYYNDSLIGAWDAMHNPKEDFWRISRIGIQSFYQNRGIFQEYLYPIFQERYNDYYFDGVCSLGLRKLCKELDIKMTIL